MSKAVKKLFKAVKKAVKWVAKNIVPILAVAAIIYTGGAALGYFQGAAGGFGAGGGILGAGQTGMAGIQAAWGQTLATGATINSAEVGANAAVDVGAGAFDAASITTSAMATPTAGLMAPGSINIAAAAPAVGGVVNTGLGAGAVGNVLNLAGNAAKATGKFMATPGGGIATAAGLQAGGAYLSGVAEEDRRREDLDRFNRETNAYGLNRYGQQVGPVQTPDFTQDFTFNPGGLMTPAAAPAPTTIDELIAARQQQARV